MNGSGEIMIITILAALKGIKEPSVKGSSSKGVRLSPTIMVVIVADICHPCGEKVI